MRERKDGNFLRNQEIIAEAMSKYKKLLEHYNIDQAVQDTVWVTVLKDFEDNPSKIVREIQGYWEAALGTDEVGIINSNNSRVEAYYNSDLNHVSKKSDAELSLNKWRRKWRNKSFEISREGNSIKARKKAKKRNKRKKSISR